MRVLVACEYSGIVRDAFTALGHDAMSCDLLPTESPGKHHQGDVGHLETKEIGLWLRGLPPLVATEDVKAATMALPAKERARVHYASPGADRGKIRSRFFEGVADAMALQWGGDVRAEEVA